MTITGIVKRGQGRGKELGFPTANIDAPSDMEDGLYLAWTIIDPIARTKLQSLIFVGANETFGESEKKAEVYVLDFNQELYDKQIEIEIIQKLRPVVKFHSSRTLVQQMRNDEREARRLFKKLL